MKHRNQQHLRDLEESVWFFLSGTKKTFEVDEVNLKLFREATKVRDDIFLTNSLNRKCEYPYGNYRKNVYHKMCT